MIISIVAEFDHQQDWLFDRQFGATITVECTDLAEGLDLKDLLEEHHPGIQDLEVVDHHSALEATSDRMYWRVIYKGWILVRTPSAPPFVPPAPEVVTDDQIALLRRIRDGLNIEIRYVQLVDYVEFGGEEAAPEEEKVLWSLLHQMYVRDANSPGQGRFGGGRWVSFFLAVNDKGCSEWECVDSIYLTKRGREWLDGYEASTAKE